MNKKILLKTLLTTSTVGLLGGGIASSLVGCSPKSQNNSGTKVLTIGASNTIGTVGTALSIVVTYSGFNYDVIGHSFELYGVDAPFFSLSAENGSGTLNVTLNTSAVEARAYNLQIKDITDDTVVPSNIVPITLNAPVVENLVIEVTSSYTGEVGKELDVAGTWTASNFDVSDATNIHLVSESLFNDFSAITNGIFTAKLPASTSAGEYPLQIQYGENVSNIINITLTNPPQKALVINISTSTITSEGTTLAINGSYEAFNIDSPTIDFASGTSQWFSVLSVDDDNKTFATTLSSDTPIGDYDLRLVAATGNDNVFSNTITFTVGSFAANDGSNWAGHTSGTVLMDLHDDMTSTISGNSNYAAENLVIPEYVFEDGKFYKVTSIGRYAFEDCSGLTGSLTIGSRVTSINNQAFYGCSGLTGSLTIPNSVVSIDRAAFASCSGLTGSLTIPNSVRSIDSSAFHECNFDDINIDDTNPTYGLATNVGAAQIVVEKEIIGGEEVCLKNYGSNDIVGCLAIGQLTIPSGVTSIGVYAFVNCSRLTGSLTIPDSVTSIGSYAFEDCSGLTGSLTIGSRVNSIGDNAFNMCNFNNIDIDDTNLTYGLATNVGDAKIVVRKTSGEFLKDYDSDDIAGSLAIGQLTILNGVTNIGQQAFRNCSGLTGSLTIPNSVVSIGNAAFYGCIGLTGSLTIPNSVTNIDVHAFAACGGLTGSLTIGHNVESIGGGAFLNCSGFTNITLDGYSSSPSWTVDTDIFDNWNNDSSSTVSTSNGSLSASNALDYLKSIGLPYRWTTA